MLINVYEKRKILFSNSKESVLESLSIVYHGKAEKQRRLCAAELEKFAAFPRLHFLEFHSNRCFIPLFNKVFFLLFIVVCS